MPSPTGNKQTAHKVAPSLPPTTLTQAFLASILAGGLTDFLFYPLDTIKIRIQSKAGFWKTGGFKGIYKGVGAVAIGSGPGAAAFFTTYEALLQSLPKHVDFLAQHPSANHLVSSLGGEVVTTTLLLPLMIATVRTQTDAYGPHTTLRSSAKNIWLREGWKGFYRGLGGSLAKNIPFTTTQFPIYEYLKTEFATRYPQETTNDDERGRPSTVQSAVAGSLSGMVAGIVTQPVDVVRTRIMLEAKTNHTDPLQSFQSTQVFPRILSLYKDEGFTALYKGVLPRTCTIMVAGGIYLGLYEWTKGWVRAEGM